MTTPSSTISIDSVLDVLADPQRRTVLRQVAVADTPISTAELVESCTRTSEASTPELTHEEWALAARHRHLPKLQDADVVQYDARDGTVERGPHFDATVSLLRVISDHRNDGSFDAS